MSARKKRCGRPANHRPHEPYVEVPGGPLLTCPGGPPAADLATLFDSLDDLDVAS